MKVQEAGWEPGKALRSDPNPLICHLTASTPPLGLPELGAVATLAFSKLYHNLYHNFIFIIISGLNSRPGGTLLFFYF